MPPKTNKLKRGFTVVQIGARMRYAVPRIFEEAGLLDNFYTDLAVNKRILDLFRLLSRVPQPSPFRRFCTRVVPSVDPRRIHAFPSLAILYAWKLRRAKSEFDIVTAHFQIADKLSERILNAGLQRTTGLYTFDTASLALMSAYQGTGVQRVMEQTNAPREVMGKLLRQERAAHPQWTKDIFSEDLDQLIMARYRKAWALADTIVCGSEFVREGIKHCNGPYEKCVVVPYGVDFDDKNLLNPSRENELLGMRIKRRERGEPWHVLSVGSVDLRKGAPYFLEAARKLEDKAIFRMVGPSEVTKEAESLLLQHVELTGLIPRNEVHDHYRWADLFLFPSICEGSATVVYEALAYGLPVICTPNTGSVVTGGEDGLLIPPSSGDAAVQALERIMARQDVWLRMSKAAFETAERNTVQHYGHRLLKALQV